MWKTTHNFKDIFIVESKIGNYKQQYRYLHAYTLFYYRILFYFCALSYIYRLM